MILPTLNMFKYSIVSYQNNIKSTISQKKISYIFIDVLKCKE